MRTENSPCCNVLLWTNFCFLRLYQKIHVRMVQKFKIKTLLYVFIYFFGIFLLLLIIKFLFSSFAFLLLVKYQISIIEYEQELVFQNCQWNCILDSTPFPSFVSRFHVLIPFKIFLRSRRQSPVSSL